MLRDTLKEILERKLKVRVVLYKRFKEAHSYEALSEETNVESIDGYKVKFAFAETTYEVVSVGKVPGKIATVAVKL